MLVLDRVHKRFPELGFYTFLSITCVSYLSIESTEVGLGTILFWEKKIISMQMITEKNGNQEVTRTCKEP